MPHCFSDQSLVIKSKFCLKGHVRPFLCQLCYAIQPVFIEQFGIVKILNQMWKICDRDDLSYRRNTCVCRNIKNWQIKYLVLVFVNGWGGRENEAKGRQEENSKRQREAEESINDYWDKRWGVTSAVPEFQMWIDHDRLSYFNSSNVVSQKQKWLKVGVGDVFGALHKLSRSMWDVADNYIVTIECKLQL